MAKEQAKDQPRAVPSSEAEQIASRLFEKFWTPKGMQYDEQWLAASAFSAAHKFLRVAAQVREGRLPEDIINPSVAISESSTTSVTSAAK